jgi:hypothetical protein
VQDADGVAVRREHLRQALVAVGRLIQVAAVEAVLTSLLHDEWPRRVSVDAGQRYGQEYI